MDNLKYCVMWVDSLGVEHSRTFRIQASAEAFYRKLLLKRIRSEIQKRYIRDGFEYLENIGLADRSLANMIGI